MKRPLAFFGLSFLTAQLFAVVLPPAAILLPAAFLMGLALFSRKRPVPASWWAAGLAVLLSFGSHGVFLALRVQPALSWVGDSGSIRAVVEESEPSFQDGLVWGVITVTEIEGRPVSFRARVEDLPDSRPGEEIRGTFAFEALPTDPWKNSRYADGVYVQAVYQSDISWLGESGALRFRLAALRRDLSFELRRYLPEPYGPILAAITTGDKSRLSDSVQAVFRRAGISHLAVVSGLHLTLICGLFAGRIDAKARLRRLRAAGCVLLTLLIMGITGFTPSICRAGLTMLLLCLGSLLLAPADGLTSLGLAGILLCLQNSYAVWDLSFQLSFCATAGVLLAGECSRRWADSPSRARRFCARAGSFLLPSTFAALATLPVQLVQGLSVSGVSVLTNLLVGWLIPPILFLGVWAALCGLLPLMALASMLFSLLAGIFVRLLWGIASFTASLPLSRLSLPPRYTLWLLFLGALAWLFCRKRRQGILLCCLLALIFGGGGLLGAALERDVVRVYLLGNGANPCAVLVQNRAACVLFRGGRANQLEVEEFLEEKGIEDVGLWVLLAQEESQASGFQADQILRAEELPLYEAESYEAAGCSLTVLNQPDGNLAVVNAGGCRLAMAAGQIHLSSPLQADVYLGGYADPAFLAGARVLITSLSYDWLSEVDREQVLYSQGTPYVEIRPGRSWQLWKGEDIFG